MNKQQMIQKIAMLSFMVMNIHPLWAQKMIIHMSDNQTISVKTSEVDFISFEEDESEVIHEYVDLGLPSGTLWATCNIGANSPEEYGDYFAWGEAFKKSEYSWSTYKYCMGSLITLTKYCTDSSYGYNGYTDGLTELLPEDDAATINWGSNWQMPSRAQLEELFNNDYTTNESTSLNGVNGYKITSRKNGNNIFLPAAGCRSDAGFIGTGSFGFSWSRSLNYCYNAFIPELLFGFPGDFGNRFYGRSVRPVYKNVEPINPPNESCISFKLQGRTATRAVDGDKEEAAKLGNKFVVSGKKGNATAATTSPIVFDNNLVVYKENTAGTTTTNSSNWEYVGINNQTIKFWDFSAPQYDFIAWSTGSREAIYSGTPSPGQVLVSSIDPNATETAAVTFKGAATDLQECYISNITTVKKAQFGKDPVALSFRNLGSKVRVGIYETVPGYSVKDVKFYTDENSALSGNATDDVFRLFSTTDNSIYQNGTYTVTYPIVDNPENPDNNRVHVSFSGDGEDQSSLAEFGILNNKVLGTASTTASYAGDPATNYYVTYLPNESSPDLNLRVDYTLESTDGSGEQIFVKNSKTQIPNIYTQWQPGYFYTYLFRIYDNFMGGYDPTTPIDPADIYPITFDSLIVKDEDDYQDNYTF